MVYSIISEALNGQGSSVRLRMVRDDLIVRLKMTSDQHCHSTVAALLKLLSWHKNLKHS